MSFWTVTVVVISAEAPTMCAFKCGPCNEFLRRYVPSEIYHMITATAKHGPDNILSNLVNVALDGAENYGSLGESSPVYIAGSSIFNADSIAVDAASTCGR